MKRLFLTIFIFVLTIIFLILVFGVYVLPIIPKNWVNLDNNVIANQIASMNYLLTFIATAGAIAGIGFTIFGFYQTQKIPEMVEEQVKVKFANERKVIEKLMSSHHVLRKEFLLAKKRPREINLYAIQAIIKEREEMLGLLGKTKEEIEKDKDIKNLRDLEDKFKDESTL